MDRAAKRPRLAHGQDSDGESQNTHYTQQKSSFEGAGLSIQGSNVQVQGNITVDSSNITETRNTISTRQRILDSLHFDQIDARQLSIKKALSKTCRWFLNTESYQQWSNRDQRSNDTRFLWIKGKPGAGKSTLMRFLLEHNRSLARRSNSKEALISFFFNARGESLEKSTIGLYRSLLLQLLKACPEAQEVLDNTQPDRPWDVDLLKDLFAKAVQALEETSIVCFVDALDECEEAQIRDMVQFLSDLVENGSRLHVCFASRHYPHITIQTGLSVILEDQNEHENDIAQYIDSRLLLKQGTRAEEIRQELQEKASGVFIWVVLVVDILNTEYEAGRIYTLRDRLRQLPSDLHNLFHDILTRDTKDRHSLLLCIQWILFAKSPLTPVQLYFALISGTEPGYLPQSHSEDYSDDNIRRFVLNNSKGLAEPTKSRNPTIQFIHESVRDFLLKEKGLHEIFPEFQGDVIGQSQERLKRCCLTYMSMESVANLGEVPHNINSQFPFLAYANQGVLHHADQAESNGLGQQEFLAAFPHSRWVKHYNCLQKNQVRRYTPKVSLRYIMAEAGMSTLIRVLPADQSSFDVEDERYGVPILAAAAAKNNDTILTMLDIEARCLPDFSFEQFCSQYPPLPAKLNASSRNFKYEKSTAILPQLMHYGSEILCLFYLRTKDDIDLRGSQYGSLISQALDNEFIEVAKLLIDKGADVFPHYTNKETPLDHAVRCGYFELVERLLNRGAHTWDTEKDGTTPLHWASRRGHIEVVKLLLDHSADISPETKNGSTPLHCASQYGHLEVVKLLLDHSADISPKTKKGSTPLHYASQNGHLEVVKLLLDHGADISAETIVWDGGTPLHNASQRGHLKVVKLLLDYGADTMASTEHGYTPLHLASRDGRMEVVKLLLDHGANISAICNDGETPLHWASLAGHLEVARLLLDRGADVKASTEHGSTPLHIASGTGRLEIVKLLLDRGADIMASTEHGHTPLQSASHFRRKEVARLLLDRGAKIPAPGNSEQ